MYYSFKNIPPESNVQNVTLVKYTAKPKAVSSFCRAGLNTCTKGTRHCRFVIIYNAFKNTI